jgi:hypothetical protein
MHVDVPLYNDFNQLLNYIYIQLNALLLLFKT